MTPLETTSSRRGGWPLVSLLLVVLAVVIFLNRPSQVPHGDGPAREDHLVGAGARVTLSLSLPGREIPPLSLQVGPGTTLLDAMHLARQRHPTWDFSTHNDGVDAFVVELAGQPNDPQRGIFWTYDLNGDPGPVGVGACQLREGDDILWKFAP